MCDHAGPRQNPEVRPVSELTHAMWFDSDDDTLEYLQKASLQPEQSSTGTWQLVLHRSLKVDHQAASFRQRSARLCSLQLPVRSQNVHDQGDAAVADVSALLGGSMATLQARRPAMQAQPTQKRVAVQQQRRAQQPTEPQTPQAEMVQVRSSIY